jgi:type VI protein secretion system component Hcp
MLGRIGRFLRNVVRASGAVKGRENTQAHQGTVAEPSGSSGLAGLTKDEFVRGRGQVALGDVSLVKELDKSSPKIAESVCEGREFPEVDIHLTGRTSGLAGQTGQTGIGYSELELEKAEITGYEMSGADDAEAPPSEEVGGNVDEFGQPGKTEREKPTRNVGRDWKVADDPDD